MPSYKKEKEFKKFLKFVLINKKADIRFKAEISQACYKEGNPRPIDGLQMSSLTTIACETCMREKLSLTKSCAQCVHACTFPLFINKYGSHITWQPIYRLNALLQSSIVKLPQIEN